MHKILFFAICRDKNFPGWLERLIFNQSKQSLWIIRGAATSVSLLLLLHYRSKTLFFAKHFFPRFLFQFWAKKTPEERPENHDDFDLKYVRFDSTSGIQKYIKETIFLEQIIHLDFGIEK